MDLVGRTGGRENQEAMSPRTTGDSLRPARPGSSKGLAGGGALSPAWGVAGGGALSPAQGVAGVGCFEETEQGREVTLCTHLEMGRVKQLM